MKHFSWFCFPLGCYAVKLASLLPHPLADSCPLCHSGAGVSSSMEDGCPTWKRPPHPLRLWSCIVQEFLVPGDLITFWARGHRKKRTLAMTVYFFFFICFIILEDIKFNDRNYGHKIKQATTKYTASQSPPNSLQGYAPWHLSFNWGTLSQALYTSAWA